MNWRADDTRPGVGRRRTGLALAAMVALTVGIHLWLGSAMRVPIIHPDEFGSLDLGRYVVRGGQRLQTEYYPGFGLVLTPVWAFTKSATTVYRVALAINAVLAGLCWAGVFFLARRLAPSRSTLTHAVVATLTSLYPPALVGTELVWSETLFMAAFVGAVLLTGRALAAPSPRRWALVGAATTGLVLVHPRGLAVAVATVLAVALCLRPVRAHRRALVVLVATLVVGLIGVELVVHLFAARPPAGFRAAYDASGILKRQFSLGAARRLVLEAVGQLWYVSVATLGLLPVALWAGARAVYRVRRGEGGQAEQLTTYCLACFAAVWVLGSLFADNGVRGDQLVYGRYLEGVIVPMIVIGLLTALELAQGRAWRRISAASVVLLGASALGVQRGYRTAELRWPANPVNVLAIHSSLRGGRIDVWLATLPALAAACLLAVLVARRPWAAAVVLAAVAVLAAADIQDNFLVPGTDFRASPNQVAVSVALVRIQRLGLAPSCVAWDAAVPTDLQYFYWADRYRLPRQRFEAYDPRRGQRPCGPLVITDKHDFGTSYPNSRLVLAGESTSQGLWVLASPLQASLDRARLLPP